MKILRSTYPITGRKGELAQSVDVDICQGSVAICIHGIDIMMFTSRRPHDVSIRAVYSHSLAVSVI